MRNVLVVFCIGLVGMGFLSDAFASNSDEAKAMVEAAASLATAQGKDKAIAEINNPKSPFVKGDLYVFAYDMTATIVAHPVNPKLIGNNLYEVPDANGKLFRKEIVELAKTKGVGWVDYLYRNPTTKKVESKTTYLKKVGEIIICCGAYK